MRNKGIENFLILALKTMRNEGLFPVNYFEMVNSAKMEDVQFYCNPQGIRDYRRLRLN